MLQRRLNPACGWCPSRIVSRSCFYERPTARPMANSRRAAGLHLIVADIEAAHDALVARRCRAGAPSGCMQSACFKAALIAMSHLVVYTWFRMRLLSLAVMTVWTLLPQVVCFLPIEKTETEMECCQRMAGDCGKANMQEHKCCTRTVKADAAIVTAIHRDLIPDSVVAPPYISERVTLSGLIAERTIFFRGYSHPPPKDPNTSLAVLRI
jgi:hypothetical protein